MKNLVIATVLAATAFATSAQSNNQETYGQTSPVSASPLSRAEVMAELRAAQASRSIAYGEFSAVKQPRGVSSLTRLQVKQELATLLQSGKFPANGESSGA